MMRLQWNALHVGGKVLVHDAGDPGMRLLLGTVTMVDAATRSYDNDIDISVGTDPHDTSVRRPARLTVHLHPLDPTESAACWRCDMIAATTAAPVAGS